MGRASELVIPTRFLLTAGHFVTVILAFYARDGAVGPLLWLAAVRSVVGRVVPRVATAAGFALAAPPTGLLATAQAWLG